MDIPGFPSNEYDWHGEEVGLALAGMVVRDGLGIPRGGILLAPKDLLSKGSGWVVRSTRFLVARPVGYTVLIGGSDEEQTVTLAPAPSANSRIDVIYTRAANVGDGETVEVLSVATGVAGAVPAKPSIPAGAEELGTVRVSAGNTGIAQAVLENTARSTAMAGGAIRFRDDSDRDAFNGVDGQLGLVGSRLYMKAGGTWRRIGGATRNGIASVTVPSGKSGGTTVVALPAGVFERAPRVFVTKQTGALANYHAYADKISPTSLTVGVFYGPGDASGTRTVNVAWEAVED